MVGKIRGVSPNDQALRIKGSLIRFWDTKRQRYITRSWPTGNGGDTPARKAARTEFKKVVQAIKASPVETVNQAQAMTQNTPWLVRDWLMMQAFGTAMILIDAKGQVWKGVRVLHPQVQGLLNSISGTIGALLVRNTDEWIVLTPEGTTAGQVLTSNGPGQTPDYQDPPPSGVQTVTPGTGIDATITDVDLEIALSAAEPYSVLANLTAGDAVPLPASVSDVLDLIGVAEGSILVRSSIGWVTLATGGAGQVLATNGTDPYWATLGGGGLISEPSLGDWLGVPANPGFDPLSIYGTTITLSNSNKTATPVSSSPYNYIRGTTARYTGKRYFECKPHSNSFVGIGVCGSNGRIIDMGVGSPGRFGERWMGQIGYSEGGTVKTITWDANGTVVTLATYATFASNDVISVAIDIDAQLIWFRKGAGNWNNSGAADPATGAGGLRCDQVWSGSANKLTWIGASIGNTSAFDIRGLTADCTQTIPTGFTAWSS